MVSFSFLKIFIWYNSIKLLLNRYNYNNKFYKTFNKITTKKFFYIFKKKKKYIYINILLLLIINQSFSFILYKFKIKPNSKQKKYKSKNYK